MIQERITIEHHQRQWDDWEISHCLSGEKDIQPSVKSTFLIYNENEKQGLLKWSTNLNNGFGKEKPSCSLFFSRKPMNDNKKNNTYIHNEENTTKETQMRKFCSTPFFLLWRLMETTWWLDKNNCK